MTPFKQIVQHNPDAGAFGDCWRTCIGCLLDLHPTLVPHFVQQANEKYGPECLTDKSTELARAWLLERGYTLMSISFDAAHKGNGEDWFGRDTLYILGGASPNIDGCHAVIGRGNFEVVWDPAPSGKGLAGPWYDKGTDAHYYTCEFLIPAPRYHANKQTGYVVDPPELKTVKTFKVEWACPLTGVRLHEDKEFDHTDSFPARSWAEDYGYMKADKGWYKVSEVWK